LEDSLLGDAAFPEDANLNAARDAAVGATDDATYAGQAMLIQWALENDMVDQELIPKEWKRDLPDGITAKHPYGYTVDPKKAGGDFRDFVQENGAVAMTRLKLDSQYLLALAVDPATPYIKPK
jgi:hypothetical protein